MLEGLIERVSQRPPDFIVGDPENPYLLRWYLLGGRWVTDRKTGEDRWISKTILWVIRPYLHCFLHSDDDRAHHDHPAPSISKALRGSCIEHTIAAGGVHHQRIIKAGDWRLRSAKFAHRIEILPDTQLWTLFIFGPNIRGWGFHCPQGWVPWRRFTAKGNSGLIGRGCD